MPNPIDYTEISNAQIDDIELKQLIENSEVLQFQKINLLDGKEPVYCDVSTGTARPYIPSLFGRRCLLPCMVYPTLAYASNGLIENFHRPMKAALKAYDTEEWSDALPTSAPGIPCGLQRRFAGDSSRDGLR
ncbi:hypothetical protein JTE90_012983 [Oedothorax gibbosus]|uniref:Integrase catalytic domain-containing protein n=1 Tax=Oedothorax gibbosus TaxID=931172 RepID=A0AAV6TNB1_9ARAC|nr:hypothetical protein JTE90_012983 [Oedothorax gibbosus]